MVTIDWIWMGLMGALATELFIFCSRVGCGDATVVDFNGDGFVDVVASFGSMSLPNVVVDKKERRRSSICSMVCSDWADKDSLSLICMARVAVVMRYG